MEKMSLNVGQISEGAPSLARLIQESRGVANEGKKRHIGNRFFYEDVVRWVKEQGYDEFTEKEVMKLLAACPQGSLNRFPHLVKNHLKAIEEKKRNGQQKKVKQQMDMANFEHNERAEAIRQEKIINAKNEVERLRREKEKERVQYEETMSARSAALQAKKAERKEEPVFQPQPMPVEQAPVYQAPPPSPPVQVQPQPQPAIQPVEIQTDEERAEIARKLEARRMFAERLRQMSEDNDDEWMKGN